MLCASRASQKMFGSSSPDRWLKLAAVLGATGVTAGAFGAHALKATLASRGTADSWKTAVSYQLIHALALLAVGTREIDTPSTVPFDTAATLWAFGTALFFGSG